MRPERIFPLLFLASCSTEETFVKPEGGLHRMLVQARAECLRLEWELEEGWPSEALVGAAEG